MNPVMVSDIENGWRPLTSDVEQSNARAAIDDAWEILVASVPNLESRLASGTLRPGLVVKVVRDAVRAFLRNPEGYARESIEDWTGQRNTTDSAGRVSISEDDIRMLSFTSPTRRAFSITPVWS